MESENTPIEKKKRGRPMNMGKYPLNKPWRDKTREERYTPEQIAETERRYKESRLKCRMKHYYINKEKKKIEKAKKILRFKLENECVPDEEIDILFEKLDKLLYDMK